MNSVAIGLTALVLSSAANWAGAGEISLVSNQEICDSAIPEDKAAIVQARRDGDIVRLDVTAQLNCAHLPGKPELREWRSAATVSVLTHSPSGAVAVCLCTHKFVFQITGLYEGAQSIYYVQDGTVLGHAIAP